MSLSQDEAHQAAQKFLDRIYSDTSMTIVLETEATEEYPWAYTVKFDSQEHIDTGEFAKAPFTRVVIVPKSGEVPYFPPTNMTTAEFYEHLTANESPTGA